MNRDAALWAGLLTGPVVWWISLEANFALSWWVCTSRWRPAAYVVLLLALLVTAGAAILSRSQWKRVEAQSDGSARVRAMAAGGVLLSAGFMIVIFAQALPVLLMNGCE